MSMTELDFPPIDTAAAESAKTSASLVVPKAGAVDLSKIDLTDVALAMYGKWPADVAAVKANLSTLALDLSTPSKITEARSLRKRLILDPLAAARKVSAGIKSKMAQTSKAVGAELERIEAGYTEADKLILPKIEAAEAEQERERQEKARIERERIEKHQAVIARIRGYAEKADTEAGMTAERVATIIGHLEALPAPNKATFEEFAVPVADAICGTLERLRITHARLLRAEQAEAEAAELRAKLAEKTTTQPAPGGEQVDGCRAPESHSDGCSGPVTQDHTSLPASPSTDYTEGRASQQVLKAEPATADATDRDAPADASPRVGAMGAGQAADDAETLLREALGLTAYAYAPFTGKFPSHPKTTPEWWAGLREHLETLQPKLIKYLEGRA